jgi:hypothetical protein
MLLKSTNTFIEKKLIMYMLNNEITVPSCSTFFHRGLLIIN